MGIFKAEISNAHDIVLRHEGEDDHSIEVHAGASGASGSGAYAPVPEYHQGAIVEGKRYYVNLSVFEVKDSPLPAPADPAVAPKVASAAKPAPAPKAVKRAKAKKPGKGKGVIARVENLAKKVDTAVKDSIDKAEQPKQS